MVRRSGIHQHSCDLKNRVTDNFILNYPVDRTKKNYNLGKSLCEGEKYGGVRYLKRGGSEGILSKSKIFKSHLRDMFKLKLARKY